MSLEKDRTTKCLCMINMFLFLPVLSNVLEKTHQYDGKDLKVQLYFDCIGIVPADHDASVPFPTSIEIAETDAEIISFIKEGRMQQFEKSMELITCRYLALSFNWSFQLRTLI